MLKAVTKEITVVSSGTLVSILWSQMSFLIIGIPQNNEFSCLLSQGRKRAVVTNNCARSLDTRKVTFLPQTFFLAYPRELNSFARALENESCWLFCFVLIECYILSYGLIYSRDLDLKKPIYQRTAAYGHFGRDSFPWEVPKKLKYWKC